MKIVKIILVAIIWFTGVGLFHVLKDLPAGLAHKGEERGVPVDSIDFLFDLTYEDLNGEIIYEQEIFDSIFKLIDDAKRYILIDAFLFNSYLTGTEPAYRRLSSEMADKLIEKKRSLPDIKIDFLTDPINTVYGGARSEEIEGLKKIGVNVIVTDLKPLRDSNPFYSPFWRTFFRWFGNSERGLLPHPFARSGDKVTARSYLEMFNFKANHRKVFAADSGEEMAVIIASANPHDGSSAHSNVAMAIKGGIWPDVFATEAAVADLSDGKLSIGKPEAETRTEGNEERVKALFLTEKAIKEELLRRINDAGQGDRIMIAQFYLADRKIIKALISAAKRNADVRVILDPNKDAFGYKKIGVPNQPVAAELIKKSGGFLKVRWYDTHKEQFHAKMTLIEKANGLSTVILGSANLTRRNLENYNLEADIEVTAKTDTDLMREIKSYFEKIWNNDNGSYYTVGYDAYKDESGLKKRFILSRNIRGLEVSSKRRKTLNL